MKSVPSLLVIGLCLVQLSCVKDPYRLPNYAKFDVNGSTWKTSALLIERDNKLNVSMPTIDPCLEIVEHSLNFMWLDKTMERQYLTDPNIGQMAPIAGFEYSTTGKGIFYGRNTLDDTAHNFIQIVHQEDNYTKNVKAIFSVTATDGRDTYYIRNGIVDFSKKMK